MDKAKPKIHNSGPRRTIEELRRALFAWRKKQPPGHVDIVRELPTMPLSKLSAVIHKTLCGEGMTDSMFAESKRFCFDIKADYLAVFLRDLVVDFHGGPEAVQRVSKLSQRVKLVQGDTKSFTCFKRLPAELRAKIWKLAVPGPRLINVHTRCDRPRGSECRERNDTYCTHDWCHNYNGFNGKFRDDNDWFTLTKESNYRLASLARTCVESNEEINRIYSKMFIVEFKSGVHQDSVIYVDPARDVYFLPCNRTMMALDEKTLGVISKFRSCAIWRPKRGSSHLIIENQRSWFSQSERCNLNKIIVVAEAQYLHERIQLPTIRSQYSRFMELRIMRARDAHLRNAWTPSKATPLLNVLRRPRNCSTHAPTKTRRFVPVDLDLDVEGPISNRGSNDLPLKHCHPRAKIFESWWRTSQRPDFRHIRNLELTYVHASEKRTLSEANAFIDLHLLLAMLYCYREAIEREGDGLFAAVNFPSNYNWGAVKSARESRFRKELKKQDTEDEDV
ncbi:hypothetical protein GLAREA_06850 [Glarea lozoyensis ATCC 20868]|uniref:2EXR domain-containing protein n=1 Tax=Glarea lozoyensis (strain ATCC 20868 / MF5171) TaxID=1116229 RepID=S3D5W8_GLAL2|nr:uncharacterized protein GLAREA_06850 [Glarea lozoyensis ATCC 20868]EPE33837.1 hypothetical protein GLAREA_06850 [Glarea lozoyensis ATCC 20868]